MQRFMRLSPIILAGLLTSAAASAQENIDFNRYDTDGDGYLTQSEWGAVNNVDKRFDSIDTNRDGRLSEAEVRAGVTAEERNISQQDISQQSGGQSGQRGNMDSRHNTGSKGNMGSQVSGVENQRRSVDMYDVNNDERVSREEAQKDGELVTYFVVWDTNQDGFLDQDEISRGNRQPQDNRRNVEYDGQPASSGQNARQQSANQGAASFRQADANRDGRVSRNEANDANAETIVVHFDTLDANQDGFVDRNEVSANENYWEMNETDTNAFDNTNRFDTYDIDDDGFLTETEWSEVPVPVDFHDVDVNRDGQVEEAELLQGYPWHVNEFADEEPYNDADPEGSFDFHDANDDGLLDENEFSEAGWTDDDFGTWDADDDGFLDEDEVNDAWFGDENDDRMLDGDEADTGRQDEDGGLYDEEGY